MMGIKTKLILFKRRVLIPTVCSKPDTSTIFQIRNCTKYISIDDVKDAFEKTKEFSYRKKVEYFGSKGIHYANARRYYQTVLNLNNTFKQELIVDVDVEFLDDNDTDEIIGIKNIDIVKNHFRKHRFDVLYIFALFVVLEVASYMLNKS